MNWTNGSGAFDSDNAAFSALPNPIGKAGASESVAVVAIIWGIALAVALAVAANR